MLYFVSFFVLHFLIIFYSYEIVFLKTETITLSQKHNYNNYNTLVWNVKNLCVQGQLGILCPINNTKYVVDFF
jgi:hypothetical protein